jgi:hypothetical protein
MNYIIPTLSRDTLGRTVKSIFSEDKFANIILVGTGNSAGQNRNIGISRVNPDLKWTLFIDDDDYYEAGYLGELKDEYDLVVLRAKVGTNWVQPPFGESVLRESKVGIHFAIKTELLIKSDIQFDYGSSGEDWRFLQKVMELTSDYTITDKVYYIAPIPQHHIKKNIVVIPAYNGVKSQYIPALKSWEFYCKKYGLELYLLEGDPTSTENVDALWDRFFDETITSKNFDRMLMVDLDTIIRWDAPDIFAEYPDVNLGVVQDSGGVQTGVYHLRQWVDFDKNIVSDPEKYFNMGVLLISKANFIQFIEELKPYHRYYLSMKGNIRLDSSDQTAANIVIDRLFPNAKRLPFVWNNMVMNKYDDVRFLNDSYIWHFTGPRMGGWANRTNIMNQVWGFVESKYQK